MDKRILNRVAAAIVDPGHVTDREHDREPLSTWSARAALTVLIRYGYFGPSKPPVAVGVALLGALPFVIGLALGAVFL